MAETVDDEYADLGTPEYWTKEFASSKKWFQKWHALVRKIEKSYLLESEADSADDAGSAPAKYNLFWANTQVNLAAMYGRMPKVEVDRTNLDPMDDVARVAGMILERIFNFEFNNVEDSPFYTYQEAILDRLVSGMGIAWARYTFTEDSTQVPHPDPAQPPGTMMDVPIITEELAPIDYVNWEDFQYSPCKRWQDKRWIARRVPMCKEEVIKRFGAVKASQVSYDLKSKAKSNEDPDKASTESQADIWEIWNKSNKSVYWYCMGMSDLLDAKVDPLQLKSFWPAKRPLVSTLLPKKFLPRPDFLYARSQYAELNLIVSRCQLLTEAIKVVGLYDKTNEGVQKLLNQASMNQLIPVDNWAMFAEKGGIKGAVDWFPLEMVITTLEKLVMRKGVLVSEVYEILGISDIQRGQATTRETATTQKLKAQYGSARTDKIQNEIARFITDNTRLRAEIICLHWQPQTILARSQIMQTPDAQYAEEAIKLLKTDPSVIARITVAADTIASPDWDLEKQQRIDFLQAISQFIGMAMPIIQTDPGAGPYMIQIMQWAATGFKGAKQIEGVLDQAYQAMLKSSQNPQPKKPNADENHKQAQADKAIADAKKVNIESLQLLAASGLPSQALAAIPPATPPGDVPPVQPPAPEPVESSSPPAPATPSRSSDIQTHQDVMKSLIEQMSKPKRIIRDETGRATGVETVNNG